MTDKTTPFDWQALSKATVRPFRFPCIECLGSRDDQISETLMNEHKEPLCRRCWERQYGVQPDAE